MSAITAITKLADETAASFDEVSAALDDLGMDALKPVAENPDGFRKWVQANPGLTVGGVSIGSVAGAYGIGEASNAFAAEQESDVVRRILTADELTAEQKERLIRKYQKRNDTTGSNASGFFNEMSSNLTTVALAAVVLFLLANNIFGGN